MQPPILHHQKERPESNNSETDCLACAFICAHCAYDPHHVREGPEKFPTRRSELQFKKPCKEITIAQSQFIVKEKLADFTCSTHTELVVANALRRRALAFDLVGICSYGIMTSYQTFSIIYILLHLLATRQSLCPLRSSLPLSGVAAIRQIVTAAKKAFVFVSRALLIGPAGIWTSLFFPYGP